MEQSYAKRQKKEVVKRQDVIYGKNTVISLKLLFYSVTVLKQQKLLFL